MIFWSIYAYSSRNMEYFFEGFPQGVRPTVTSVKLHLQFEQVEHIKTLSVLLCYDGLS